MYAPFNMAEHEYLILEHVSAITLALLLIISELIGCSKCVYNSITQYLYSYIKKTDDE